MTRFLWVAPALLLFSPMLQAQEPPKPRPGLTAIQTQQAVRIAGGSLEELRKKTEGANHPDADRREYIVGVERLATKSTPASGDGPAKAVVTTYRYFDDTTIYTTVDLDSGQALNVQTAQHMRTPLSDGEYEAAKVLAREKSDEVKALYERFGKRLEVYPQFSQYTPDGETRVHRVVHLLFRVDKRDLSAPRVEVDLTTRAVRIPKPEALPGDPNEARNRPAPEK